jgi:glycosyltransferase involved in cell wall biosynthesis
MKATPVLVSVITPCFNCARFVRSTVESVRAQTLSAWEHIVVDDGSTDDSHAIVASLCGSDDRLSLVRTANGGVAKARNTGLRSASDSSEFVLFLDADDVIDIDMLALMAGYLSRRSDVDMVHCNVRWIDADGTLLDSEKAPDDSCIRYVPTSRWPYVRQLGTDEPVTPFVSFVCVPGVIPSASMFRKKTVMDLGGFDECFGQPFEDNDLFARVALRGRVEYLPRTLVSYRRHSLQNMASEARASAQAKKFFSKWLAGGGLSLDERRAVMNACRFREFRLIPYTGLRHAKKLAAGGRYALAARYSVGAIRRLLASAMYSSEQFGPHYDLPEHCRRLRSAG